VRAAVDRAAGLGDVVRRAGGLKVRTLVFDVEPLVAHWDGGQQALDQGITRVLSEVAVLPAVEMVCFASNSLRRPSVPLGEAGMRVVYLASAGKPLRTSVHWHLLHDLVSFLFIPLW
jgi:hypothetical protein